jgi:cell division protease FtsH
MNHKTQPNNTQTWIIIFAMLILMSASTFFMSYAANKSGLANRPPQQNHPNQRLSPPAKQVSVSQKTMTYSDLLQMINTESAKIKSIAVLTDANGVLVELVNKNNNEPDIFVAIPGDKGREEIIDAAQKAKVNIKARESIDNPFIKFLFSPLGIGVILLVLFLLVMFRGTKGAMNPLKRFSSTPAKVYLPGEIDVTLDDVAGCEEAKHKLPLIVTYLKNPELCKQVGMEPPSGVLLLGPPGTGKTLLARAIAGVAGLPFVVISASEFIEMLVGVGSARVKATFQLVESLLKKYGGCFLFIDELDAIGRQRGTGMGGGNDEREQTLNQLLIELDGFFKRPGMVVIGATNRADILDPALIRKGRLDCHIPVEAPDLAAREAIFAVHTKGKPTAANIDFRALARRITGLTGADIRGACNAAASICLERAMRKAEAKGKSELEPDPADLIITNEDFDEGIDEVQWGEPNRSRSRAMTPEQKKNTAIHEACHAAIIADDICQFILNQEAKKRGVNASTLNLDEILEERFSTGNFEIPDDYTGDVINKVTIMPRARALGYAEMNSRLERFGHDETELLTRIRCAVAGRKGQELFLDGTRDSGAQNDFERSWHIARLMVTKLGMSKLGIISIADGEMSNPFLGKSIAVNYQPGAKLSNAVDSETQRIIRDCEGKTTEILKRNECRIWRITNMLLEKETILGAEFWQLWISPGCKQ